MPGQKYRAGADGAASGAGHPELGSGSASTGRSGAGVANGTRYRYIGDENLVPLENAGGNAGAGNAGAASAQAGTTAAAKTRSRPNSEYVLYSNGEPVAMSADGDTSYFGTDILGSVRSVTDKYGNVKASYEYDAFGTPYLANLENDVGFGYTGKIFDSATGLYDYGFRDYAPNSARFTTVDPVRDGSNWFSYCMNDAVNYVDLWGLNPIEDFIYGEKIQVTVDGETITVQQSSPLLENLAQVKDNVSETLIDLGNKTGIQLFVDMGEAVSQIPTGRIDNQTGDYLAFAGEHSELGDTYLAPGVTFVFKDYVTTRGEYSGVTAKMVSIGDATVTQSEVIFTTATSSLNNTANNVKTFLAETAVGQWINNRINNIVGHPITTEQHGVYSNSSLLSSNGDSTAPKLSGNITGFKKDNSKYFTESSNISSLSASNVTFSNITFDGSENAVLAQTTDFSARVNEFSKNAFNINPYSSNSFLGGGCTK